MLSTDAAEPEGATVGWPLEPRAASVPATRLELLLDGLPTSIAAERNRTRGVRRPAYGLILAAGFFELLFLLVRNRRSDAQVKRRMRRLAEEADELRGESDERDNAVEAPAPVDGAVQAASPDASTPKALADVAMARAARLDRATERLSVGPGLVWLTVLAAGVMLAFAVLAALAAWG